MGLDGRSGGRPRPRRSDPSRLARREENPDMTEAVGIHDHETKKLGKRPPSNRPALLLRDHLLPGALERAQGPLPGYPAVDPSPNIRWPMDMNDQRGDRVVAGAGAHCPHPLRPPLAVPSTHTTQPQLLPDPPPPPPPSH